MNTEGSFQCDCPLGHELSPSREDCVGEFVSSAHKTLPVQLVNIIKIRGHSHELVVLGL